MAFHRIRFYGNEPNVLCDSWIPQRIVSSNSFLRTKADSTENPHSSEKKRQPHAGFCWRKGRQPDSSEKREAFSTFAIRWRNRRQHLWCSEKREATLLWSSAMKRMEQNKDLAHWNYKHGQDFAIKSIFAYQIALWKRQFDRSIFLLLLTDFT